MEDLEEEDTKHLERHRKIAKERMAVALPIIVTSGVVLLVALITLVVMIVRASSID